MKILYFSLEMPALLKDSREFVGGAAVQWKSWMHGFLAAGHQFGILTWEGANSYINKDLNIEIVESFDPKAGIKNIRLFYPQMYQLFKAVKKHNPDCLIQSSATAYTGILMIISKILGIPFIHRLASDVHVDERLTTLINKKEIFLYKLGVKYADYIFTQNSYQSKKLIQKYPEKNIKILHNPYEVTEKIRISPKAERTYIAWIGNFRLIKNLPALFTVALSMPKHNFKIAGVESIADDQTREAVNGLKRLNNVEFVGYLTRLEIKPFLAKSIALINTSFTEGFSNTFLEAWSCGTPVVSTIHVNPDEIITKNNLGRISDSYENLSYEIMQIIEMSETDYNLQAINCYEYVINNHDPKTLAEKFVFFLNTNS